MTGARDRVLDAYETVLIEHGPGSATLDAVAAAAEVSKGGLLYHFSSKDALATGLLDRLRERSSADAAAIRAAPDGAVAYYIRTSAPGGGVPGGVTRTYLAVLRLADGTETGQAVRDALAVVHAEEYDALRAELTDPVLAWIAQLVGDGLYLRTLTGTPLPPGLGVEELLSTMRTYLPPPSAT
ncbi:MULTISPECIES: TetR/AcrR family transcriptional regulator [unclassified Pseudonocardia]|jgi:AcrR family transcriptional regulator|uniref:TetR/AcrR family transcriptional regulator n=1 Tax=unclassified Pseudonocardia TaxID=2619320 RepID=UPI00095F407C|nr:MULTISPECIES: TetR/AcrR family transcriptional regulator [unclassified Pseudonocardia]MBN9098914.1 TetR/AcrR family transcriptional regulator [Pseudonocardia sp.]OJY40664.1 MAG: TetR family transcriptional regulator [Pseudonocardia sp. 73-21]